MLSHFFRHLRQTLSSPRPSRRPSRRLSLDALEDRTVPATVYGLAANNLLIRFDSSSPTVIQNARTVTGLGGNETLQGIDFRPRTGQLVGSTVVTGSANNSILKTYRINPLTGVATLIGQTAAALAGAGDVPGGYDFNPTVDRIRYVNSNNENARLNPNNGLLAGNDTDLTFTAPAVGPIIGQAYDRNFDRPNATGVRTTLYGIDRGGSRLVVQGGLDGAGPGGPNAGAITNVGPLGITLAANSDAGFDIADSTDNGGLGTALAALTVGATTSLYTINLTTGVATLVGNIGSGQTRLFSLAIVPNGQIVVAAGPGAGPQVRVLDPTTGAERRSITAFANFNGGVRVATGDITRDGIPDVAVVAQTANGHVRVFDGATGVQLPAAIGNFLAFPAFGGTVNIAVGDVNGDTFGDVIVVANDAQGHVKVFSGADGSLIANFLAFPTFFGGVTVSAGDFDNDGDDEIVVATSSNGHVKVLNANGTIFTGVGNFVGSFLSFQGYFGVVSVAVGDVNGDGLADIIAATGAGTRGHVKAFNPNGGVNLLTSFLAFEAGYTGGASVGVADFNTDGLYDIAATPGSGRASVVKLFSGITAVELGMFDAFAGSTAGATVGGVRF